MKKAGRNPGLFFCLRYAEKMKAPGNHPQRPVSIQIRNRRKGMIHTTPMKR